MANNDQSNLADLLARVRAEDDVAFETLQRLYRPLLRSEVERYAGRYAANAEHELCHADKEELAQVASLKLYQAAKTYCEGKGEAGFGAYAKICISNALCSLVYELCGRRATLPDTEAEDIPSDEDVSASAADAQKEAEMNARISAVLTPYENRVWQLYKTGARTSAIAQSLGKAPHSIENAVFRIKRKLQRVFRD